MNFLTMPSWLVRWGINFWPPLLFAGIRVLQISEDYRYTKVTMPLRFYNKNILGIQYGGSLFSMTDPWLMSMLWQNLGSDYRVVDKAASIDFIKPGKSRVSAEFVITEADLMDIKQQTAEGEKYLKTFTVHIKDSEDQLVAEVLRTIYIRRKPDL